MRNSTLSKLLPVSVLFLSQLVFSQAPVQALTTAALQPVAVGENSSCAIRSSDDLYCVGSNTYGQLGTGNTTSNTDPQKVLGIANVAGVSVGTTSACAVTYTGELYCWGSNSAGQLGIGNNENKTVATLVTGLSNVSEVSVGNNFACALTRTGAVHCWGSNEYGQLGQESIASLNAPVLVNGLPTAFTAVTARGNRVCVVSSDVYCWGEFSDNSFTSSSKQATPTKLDNSAGAFAVSLGNNFGCARFSSFVSCWGSNNHGQLGVGNKTDSNTLQQVSGINAVKQLVTGSNFACVLDTAGDTFCWGENQAGQLGITAGADQPTRIPTGASKSAFLASYGSTSCSLKLDGYVACIGDVSSGQSGVLATSASVLLNTQVSNAFRLSTSTTTTCAINISTISALYCWGPLAPEDTDLAIDEVSVGNSSACAISNAKNLYCWGSNSSGQLGDSSVKSSTLQLNKVASDASFSKVAVGYRHACAVTDTGLVYCWGDNSRLQLGSTGADSKIPKAVPGIGTAVSIAVGDYHSCAQLQDGAISCWGDNSKRQINASTTTQLSPSSLVLSGSVRGYSLGSFNTCLLTSTGPWSNSLNCFGDNSKKQSPGVVSGSYKEVSAGSNTVCAVNSQDLVYCFGSADSNKINGVSLDTSTPTKISDVPSRLVAVGGSHVCSTTIIGRLGCWGSNTHGQLTSSFGYPDAFAKPVVLIQGSKALGETLTAKVFSTETNITNSYLWKRASVGSSSFASLTSQTKSTLTTSGTDLGRVFMVEIKQSKWGITSSESVSSAYGPIRAQVRILLTPVPLLSGSNKVGKFLIARPGRWDTGVKLSYQWYRGSTIIKGATKSSYQLVAADVGKQISVAVSGVKSGLPKATKRSAKTSKIVR
jgi:alpha-tubulin suppressor-like RCC1 family protein